MLTALKEIGEVILQKDSKTPPEIIIENPEYENAIVLYFDENLNFQKVGLEKTNLSEENYKLYLYRKGPSNGLGYSPTIKFTDMEKTFIKKFLPWFKDKNGKFSKMYQEISGTKKQFSNKSSQ